MPRRQQPINHGDNYIRFKLKLKYLELVERETLISNYQIIINRGILNEDYSKRDSFFSTYGTVEYTSYINGVKLSAHA